MDTAVNMCVDMHAHESDLDESSPHGGGLGADAMSDAAEDDSDFEDGQTRRRVRECDFVDVGDVDSDLEEEKGDELAKERDAREASRMAEAMQRFQNLPGFKRGHKVPTPRPLPKEDELLRAFRGSAPEEKIEAFVRHHTDRGGDALPEDPIQELVTLVAWALSIKTEMWTDLRSFLEFVKREEGYNVMGVLAEDVLVWSLDVEEKARKALQKAVIGFYQALLALAKHAL